MENVMDANQKVLWSFQWPGCDSASFPFKQEGLNKIASSSARLLHQAPKRKLRRYAMKHSCS